jgi:hypothetical protein
MTRVPSWLSLYAFRNAPRSIRLAREAGYFEVVVTQNPAVGADLLAKCKVLSGVGGAMGRFFRAIRGFFGSLLTGVEQRNPEILLETVV